MTLGVVGLGRLGRHLAEYANFFGMRVVAADPFIMEQSDNIQLVELDCLLRQSDVISLHANYSLENHHFWAKEQFNKMKQGSFFINTARGELVDEAALLAALESGKLAGAALDVLDNEYSDDFWEKPLLKYASQHDNLILTPHIGGCTADSMHKTEEFIAHKVFSLMCT